MSKSIDELTNCPKCNELWKKEDIYECMFQQYSCAEKAKQAAECYGWTEENKKFFSNIIGIYDEEVDMTVAYQCPNCKTKWCRFTNKII